MNRPGKIGCKGLIVAVLAALGIMIAITARKPVAPGQAGTPSPAQPKVDSWSPVTGDFALLGQPGMHTVWLCLDEASWNDMLDAQNLAAKGGEGAGGPLFRLAQAGKVLAFEAGTRVRVVKTSMLSRKVEILGGEDMGKEGWVQTELLSPDASKK